MMNWVDENAASIYNDRDVALQLANIVFGAIHTTSQVSLRVLHRFCQHILVNRKVVNSGPSFWSILSMR